MSDDLPINRLCCCSRSTCVVCVVICRRSPSLSAPETARDRNAFWWRHSSVSAPRAAVLHMRSQRAL